MWLRLSYTINAATPTSADIIPPVEIQPIERIANGDRSNLSCVRLANHYGTHIDAPNHFNATGRRLVDFPIADFIFERPCIVDIPKSDMETISAQDLAAHEPDMRDADLVLLRTGFGRSRATDRERYRWQGPWVTAEAARYIMDELPNLRALGMDFISLESTSDLSHNFEAHCTLLGDNDRPLMLIEDLDLDIGNTIIRRVYAFPLFFDDLDSFPCTVAAETAS